MEICDKTKPSRSILLFKVALKTQIIYPIIKFHLLKRMNMGILVLMLVSAVTVYATEDQVYIIETLNIPVWKNISGKLITGKTNKRKYTLSDQNNF